jgi:fatty acyl-CoA reductase
VLGDYAEAEGLRLDESMAYADSASDLPMLEAVGFPVAVNPEAKLAAIARRRGWHVEHWTKADGGAEPPLPLGPLDRRGSRRRGYASQAALSGAKRRSTAEHR